MVQAESPWPTPPAALNGIQVVESSSPWSKIVFGELNTEVGFRTSPDFKGQFVQKPMSSRRARLRNLSQLLWLSMAVVIITWWWVNREERSRQFSPKENQSDTRPNLEGLQFIDANDPHIRYVGRWTSPPDKTRRDASFPGVYFDFAVNGTRTVLLSLHNIDQSLVVLIPKSPANIAFLPNNSASGSAPISLLTRIDDDGYDVMPNSSSIVSIRAGNLDYQTRHEIRIIAPMGTGETVETLQVEGLWIEEGGQLLPRATDDTSGTSGSYSSMPEHTAHNISNKLTYQRMLEIVTDLPGSTSAGKHNEKQSRTRGILDGVLGWEYLLGEMFGIDHVSVGMDGMCLIQDCIGGKGNPTGLADVFFQSGPVGSEQFAQPWLFEEYVPEAMVMNIGHADFESFQSQGENYNKTSWELSLIFEETYISLIKAIRTLAYPTANSAYGISKKSNDATFPIFVMRPFRGQLEQTTRLVVDRLRMDGYEQIYWLDTSGWLNTDIDFDAKPQDQDFFLDEDGSSRKWRLTERGNQRVAILLHLHVCRYLARDAERCAFLAPEVYEGKTDRS